MPLREDILAPIAGENPSGIDLRYDTKLLIYDKIREARRQDDGLAQGDWQSERKVANYASGPSSWPRTRLPPSRKISNWPPGSAKPCWRLSNTQACARGSPSVTGLLTNFWETLYPVIEDGDRELRAKPLSWIGSVLDLPLRSAPLVSAGYSWFAFKDSRVVGFEDQAKTDKDRKARAKLIEEGKIAPEAFDKAFSETPKAFYLKAEKDLDCCLAELESLETFCNEKFEDDAPPFGKLRTALTDVRHTVHGSPRTRSAKPSRTQSRRFRSSKLLSESRRPEERCDGRACFGCSFRKHV